MQDEGRCFRIYRSRTAIQAQFILLVETNEVHSVRTSQYCSALELKLNYNPIEHTRDV